MKHLFLLFLILFSASILAQVPEPTREIREAVAEPIRNYENAGYYQQTGKYGFEYPEKLAKKQFMIKSLTV